MAAANRTNPEINKINAAKIRAAISSYFYRAPNKCRATDVAGDSEIKSVMEECGYDKSHVAFHLKEMARHDLIDGAKQPTGSWVFAKKGILSQLKVVTPTPEKAAQSVAKVTRIETIEIEVAGVSITAPTGSKIVVSPDRKKIIIM